MLVAFLRKFTERECTCAQSEMGVPVSSLQGRRAEAEWRQWGVFRLREPHIWGPLMWIWAVEKDLVRLSVGSWGEGVLFQDGGPHTGHSEKVTAVVLNQGQFCHRGPLERCGDLFGYHDWAVGWGWRLMLLSLREARPGMLLDHHTAQDSSHDRDLLGPRWP